MIPFQVSLSTTMKKKVIFNPSNINHLVSILKLDKDDICKSKGIEYFNIPCAFDIEASSFYDGGEKTAIMYEWTFGIGGLVIIGRTWNEFNLMIHSLSRKLNLGKKKRLICYVHNLAYDSQFFRRIIEWDNVFALKERQTLSMLSVLGIEFRCSYLLSAFKLEKLGEQLRKYKVKKMVGDLDYELIRHSKTKLTDKELQYCINDVVVLMCYIQEKLETEGKICYLPKTNTGYVRNFVRQYCFYEYGCKDKKKSHKAQRYRSLMSQLTLDVEEYKQLKEAYTGGFTHASCFHSGKTLINVTSMDFTSSYPAVLVTEPSFPMSKGEIYEIRSRNDFLDNIKHYCCLFNAHFEGIESDFIYEHFLSESHCRNIKNAVVDNGRIVSADSFDVTLTEIDYMIMKKCYSWKKFSVSNFRRYKKGYLPRDFVNAILKLYSDKTTLKGVENKEVEYQRSKGMLNACYGMCCTDPARDEILYEDNVWSHQAPNLKDIIEKYNKSSSRFLFYPWGVWCCKLAMRNLWTGIFELKQDYVYADTDSVKFLNYENHKAYFEKYNSLIQKQSQKAMESLRLDDTKTHPKTIENVEKPIGVWDYDGSYKRFKALGAKRYLVEYAKDDKILLTVSGVNKKIATPWLIEKYGKDGCFDAFDNHLFIPKEYTGTNTHTYIDSDREGIVTDYLGVKYHYYEHSAVHIEKSDYTMSLSKEYTDYLAEVEEIE